MWYPWFIFMKYHRKQNKYYPQRCLLAHFKVIHWILAVENLLAHNNILPIITHICYCGQISLQSTEVNWSFSGILTPLWVTYILLAMVHHTWIINWRELANNCTRILMAIIASPLTIEMSLAIKSNISSNFYFTISVTPKTFSDHILLPSIFDRLHKIGGPYVYWLIKIFVNDTFLIKNPNFGQRGLNCTSGC